MRRLANSEHIARVFEHHVLKSAAGSKERNLVFSRMPDAEQRVFQAFIGATWAQKQSLIPGKVLRRICREPHSLTGARLQILGSMLEGVTGCGVGRVGRVVIANNSYFRFFHRGRMEPRFIGVQWILAMD
jgi:hypothetical protein